mmetsp:Transcript_18465/g.27446  ORF Transcript_18465/g.27446 Transcript_18465/m.27446 type:complete len:118 (-) Transcript_18465:6-359(-)
MGLRGISARKCYHGASNVHSKRVPAMARQNLASATPASKEHSARKHTLGAKLVHRGEAYVLQQEEGVGVCDLKSESCFCYPGYEGDFCDIRVTTSLPSPPTTIAPQQTPSTSPSVGI